MPALLVAVAMAAASAATPRQLQVQLRASGEPQVAVWVEDAEGRFVDTVMVTALTGSYGLGNRPGRSSFGGGYRWPYGRRENVLPVWAHRRGVRYPRLVFQDCREDSLGWHERFSSVEDFYCRPTTPRENASVDALSCPTHRFSSDKGIPMAEVDRSEPLCDALFDRYDGPESVYPPRNDLVRPTENRDWSGAGEFRRWNDLDAVSQATPPSGAPMDLYWSIPDALAPGRYTVWVEVNQAFDPNEHHDYDFFVDPQLPNYGMRVNGQPSVLWRVPIEVGDAPATARALEHVGYGSPTGADGELNPADGTITTGVEGTGAGRLVPVQSPDGPYQVRVDFRPAREGAPCEAPPRPSALEVQGVDWAGVDLLVEMPGTDPDVRFSLKYALGHDAIRTEEDFLAAPPGPVMDPGPDVTGMAIRFEPPTPQAEYTVALRAERSSCGAESEFLAVNVTSPERQFAPVDACFVATAAHGADYAREVRVLRRFRDEVLLPTEAGLTAVELYYYLSPSIAELIREHPSLRRATRWALAPLVWWAEEP